MVHYEVFINELTATNSNHII